MPKNICKVLTCLFIALGDFVPFTVLLSFMSQLYKQLGFGNLGILIFTVIAFTSIFGSLVSPALLLRYSSKRIIIISSFGTAIWIVSCVLPVACVNLGHDKTGVCSLGFVSTVLLGMTLIGGTCFVINLTALFIYVLAWAEREDIPIFQGMLYSLFLWGKVISSVVFTATMTSARAQLVFFIAISIASFAASFGFLLMSEPPKKVPPPAIEAGGKINDSVVESAEPKKVATPAMPSLLTMSFTKALLLTSKQTLQLAFSKQMLQLLPYIFYTAFVKDVKLALMPLLLNQIMEKTENRFVINQWTGYISICDSLTGIVFGIVVGAIVPLLGKKVVGALSLCLGFLDFIFILIIFYLKAKFGAEWFLASLYLAMTLCAGMTIQFSIYATDFKEREKAFGAGNMIMSISSLFDSMIFSMVSINGFGYVTMFGLLEMIVAGYFLFQMRLSKVGKARGGPVAM